MFTLLGVLTEQLVVTEENDASLGHVCSARWRLCRCRGTKEKSEGSVPGKRWVVRFFFLSACTSPVKAFKMVRKQYSWLSLWAFPSRRTIKKWVLSVKLIVFHLFLFQGGGIILNGWKLMRRAYQKWKKGKTINTLFNVISFSLNMLDHLKVKSTFWLIISHYKTDTAIHFSYLWYKAAFTPISVFIVLRNVLGCFTVVSPSQSETPNGHSSSRQLPTQQR